MTTAPFSDDDFQALAALLDEHSPRDLDGVLGLFHAIASAPGLVTPSAWLPLVAPNGPGDTALVPLALGLYNDVLASLDRGMAMLPEPHDVEGCASFANGYVDGALLDPEWVGTPSRWAFAAWAAYLADRNDLVPAGMRAQLATLGTEDKAKAATRLEMADLVKSARESIRKPATATAGPRVGRNDPCPCGSGKKHKKCCLGAAKPSH